MAMLENENTKVSCQGIFGAQNSIHAEQSIFYCNASADCLVNVCAAEMTVMAVKG